MELTSIQKKRIIDNFVRRCDNCEKSMQPLSTTCICCGRKQEFQKIDEESYIEHFEIKKCAIEKEPKFHYCIHPKIDSQINELEQHCVSCITKQMVRDGGASVVKSN